MAPASDQPVRFALYLNARGNDMTALLPWMGETPGADVDGYISMSEICDLGHPVDIPAGTRAVAIIEVSPLHSGRFATAARACALIIKCEELKRE